MLTKSGKARVFGASLLLAAGAAVGLGGGSAAAVPPGIPDAAAMPRPAAATRLITMFAYRLGALLRDERASTTAAATSNSG